MRKESGNQHYRDFSSNEAADLKLHSTSKGAIPLGVTKKSVNTHPRGIALDEGDRDCSSHSPSLVLTPLTPIFHAGKPNPFATTGGMARGKEPAEKKEMFNVGCVYPVEGGKRTAVARETFSGIEKKEGILYLRSTEQSVRGN